MTAKPMPPAKAGDGPPPNHAIHPGAAAGLGASLLLAACGGGTDSATSPVVAAEARSLAAPRAAGSTVVPAVSDADASRFLAQASMGASRAQIAQVQQLGYAGWLDAQFAMPPSGARWDWLIAKGYNAITYRNTETGFDASAWRKLLSSPDTLRQRITLALSEITVAAIDGLVGAGWRAFSAAAYLDLLEANAFGNYRTLLGQISTSAPMGQFLTFRGNVKYNPATGALPDENYARELMQLFSIGLQQLNLDGTPKLAGGTTQDTYGQDDITGLARVFTGWDFDMAGKDASTPDFLRRAMIQIPSRHETGASTFLGTTVPAGLTGAASMKAALDWIFAHPNVAPFISRQLIQKLVTSNPSPAYVARVATVFNNDGAGVKGNLKAVIRALLLDSEARNNPSSASAPAFGKLREPMLRFIAWARAYSAASASDAWGIGNTSDPAARLGQSPLRSPSVFNFFRPGYVPPNSAIAAASLVAPEFQITNESSVVGYVNYMQRAVSTGIGDVIADYSSLLPLADNAQSLLDEINIVLAAGQIGGDNLALMRGAINAMPSGTDARRRNRIYAALTLVLAAPEFIVQK
ncbi:DUF1800 domain-containing protein [Undibacterium sp.]|uniref:DUF1800 domain-containing protein n=1 Tax=Undibacterium sp. TaxID=1914977 RepID=UPI002CED6170|nr:DUF1800 domain-containing protein [Undibacterium sp.]HTD05911.1 DUF1800 domain-containing protein [Undibacterium sp.]